MTIRASGLLFSLALAVPVQAQTPSRVTLEQPAPTVTISLRDALSQAVESSPSYRSVLNNAGPARLAVKSAYGQLLPSVDVRGGFGYTGSGSSSFGGSLFSQVSPSLTSSYGISLGLQLDGSILTGPRAERANQDAVTADIGSAERQLTYEVTSQYLISLQAAAQTEVSRQQVIRNTDFLALAQARQQVGQATLLDVRQAEVTRGQSEVDLLQARQRENEAKLELLRRMGVQLPVSVTALGLSDSFPVSAPGFRLEELMAMADADNPGLRADRARERAASTTVTAAKSQYLPRLNLSASWDGFTQEFTNSGLLVDQATGRAISNLSNCTFQNDLISALPGGGIPGYDNGGRVPDCKDFVGLDATGEALQPVIRDQLISDNNAWPFSFTRQPFRASVGISVPIFTGFSRNLQVARASAARDDATEQVRATRLAVRADVEGRYLALDAAWQAIGVQQANRAAAAEQLTLAQERFRLGSGSSLEVSDALAAVARAEGDYVNAIYAYHRAIADLEFAVGRPLR